MMSQQIGELVSRQAALESIRNLYPDMPIVDIMSARRKWLDKYAPYFECENAIEQLPSINPQAPKTGHWIETDSDDSYWYMCSECHRRTDEKSDYCPSCGAKMVESQESEDQE